MDKKITIAVQQRILTHYRIPLFEELISRLSDVTIFYGNKHPQGTIDNGLVPSKKQYWKIHNYYPFRSENIFFSTFLIHLNKIRPSIIIVQGNIGNLAVWCLYLLRYFYQFKVIVWGHGWDRRRGIIDSPFFKHALELFFLRKADAIILYSNSSKTQLESYLSSKKIFVAPNTIDIDRHLILYKELRKEGRDHVKRRIGFTYKYNLIFIGRLMREKEPLRLLDIFHQVVKTNPNCALQIVGDGPLENSLQVKIASEHIPHVVLHGGIYNETITADMLFSSDLFVMPASLGLAINHSFCYECPVITQSESSNGPPHGPEIEYLEHGKTGFMIPYGDNDSIAQTILKYLDDKSMQEVMRNYTANYVYNNLSISKMVDQFEEAMKYVVK